MNKIAVFTQGKVKFPYNDIPKSYITSVVRKSLKLLTLENVSISIIVSDNDFITKINSDYRKKNYATDVISFAYREQPFPEIKEENEVLGDIYVSAEKAAEQAEEIGHSLKDWRYSCISDFRSKSYTQSYTLIRNQIPIDGFSQMCVCIIMDVIRLADALKWKNYEAR